MVASLVAIVKGAPIWHYKFEIEDVLVRGIPTRNVFGTMSYLLGNLTSGEAAIIDSGGNTNYAIQLAAHYGLAVTALLQTHAHVDHIQGLPEMKKNFPSAAVYLHRDDAELYAQKGIPVSEAMRLGGHLPAAAFSILSLSVGAVLPEPDVWVEDGELISAGGVALHVLHTPGHSPGHVCYYAEMIDMLFCGDLILGAGVGRTDLYGGSHEQLVESIAKVCREVFPNATILSGHAEPVELLELVGRNPYVRLPPGGGSPRRSPQAAQPLAGQGGSQASGTDVGGPSSHVLGGVPAPAPVRADGGEVGRAGDGESSDADNSSGDGDGEGYSGGSHQEL